MFKLQRTPNKIFFLLTLYVLLLGLARVLLSDGIEVDEAEQSYLSQWLLWGYNIQPPLYTWMYIGVSEVLGNHYWVQVFFRMFLLLLSYYGIFCIFSRISKKVEVGVAATVFCLFLLQFSTESLRQTHTVLVTVAGIWSIWCLIQIKENPKLKYYILFGFTLAAGILSKYNFLFFISSLCLAVFMLPKWRKILFSWKSLVTAIIVTVLISPHLWWVYQHLDALTTDTAARMSSQGDDLGTLALTAKGLWVLISNMLAFLSVFLIIFVLFHLNDWRENGYLGFRNEWIVFFEYFFLFSFLQFVAIVLLSDSTIFPQRWIQPFFIFFPGYCFLKFYPDTIPTKRLQWFKRIGYFAASVTIIVVIARTAILPMMKNPIWLNKPHTQFCEDINSVLEKNQIEVIVTDHILLAGYFRMSEPNKKVINLDSKYTLVSQYDKTANILFIWSWAWVEGVEDGVAKGKTPKLINNELQQQTKTLIEADMLTYDYHYCPSKKCSYDYVISP